MARVVFPSVCLIALNLCLCLYSSNPVFAASPSKNITSMLPENKVPQASVEKICGRTKDPNFCNKFAAGDMETLLTIGDQGKTKVLNTAIDIVLTSQEQFSSTLKDEKISVEEKRVAQTCLDHYETVNASLKESATTEDSLKLGHQLQAAGEALWQCEVSLQSTKHSNVANEIRISNSLTNYFVSYVQSMFYAHIATKY